MQALSPKPAGPRLTGRIASNASQVADIQLTARLSGRSQVEMCTRTKGEGATVREVQ